MAEPGANPAKPDKKGNLFKKKVAGIPVPILLVVGGVAVYYLYTKYKASQPASTSSTATPTASSGQATGSQGDPNASGGGSTDPGSTLPSVGYAPLNNGIDPSTGLPWSGFGYGTPVSPTDTSGLTPAPTSTANQSNITPTGSKTVNIGGKSYSTVSGFLQNGNQYLGVDNPAEAKRLTAAGVHLVQNPNDPNGKGEFILIPKGAKGPVIKKPAPKPKAKARPKVKAK